MKVVKIVALCIVGSVVYGILHDLVTAHVCVEYFSQFHPDVFHTDSPLLLALGWGVIATWWMGLFLGPIVGGAARAGQLPKLGWRDLVRPLATVFGISYAFAMVGLLVGYFLFPAIPSQLYANVPRLQEVHLPPEREHLFMADLIAHNTSYIVSTLGALGLCVWCIVRRIRLGREAHLTERGIVSQ
jgi:hypothetical protein